MNKKQIITVALTAFITLIIGGVMTITFDGLNKLDSAINYPEESKRKDSLQDARIKDRVTVSDLKIIELERSSNNDAIRECLLRLITLQKEANKQRGITIQRISRIEGKLGLFIEVSQSIKKDTIKESYYVINK